MNKEKMKSYVEGLIANGASCKTYTKFARVLAREAKEGEVIETILTDGHRETSNKANAGDWIVTNPGGESYIVPANKFGKKYEPAPELGEGWFKPTGGIAKFIQISENISFICSWGEAQNMRAGSFISITSLDDIYGIAEQEFYDTYKECTDDGNFC